MNFQEFLSDEELRHRSLGANRSGQDPRHRASYLHEGTLVVSDRMRCGRYKHLGNVGFEAILVDSEALDL
jgi:hypothetical protein